MNFHHLFPATIGSVIGDDRNTSTSYELSKEFHDEEKQTASMLIGPQQSGRTSILFQYAVRLAQSGKNVLFICCSRNKMRLQRPLPFKDQADPDITTLQRVTLIYVETATQLRQYWCNLDPAAFAVAPTAVIVDDFDLMFTNEGTPFEELAYGKEVVRIAKTAALVLESVTFFQNVLQTQLGDNAPQCHCIISLQFLEKDSAARCYRLLERWFPFRVGIHKANGERRCNLYIQPTTNFVDPFSTKITFDVDRDHLSVVSIECVAPSEATADE